MGNDHMFKYRETIGHCASCMGGEIGSGQCRSWVKSLKREKCGDGFDCCYANTDQVTAILDYWDAKNGTIQERIKNESEWEKNKNGYIDCSQIPDIDDKDFREGDLVWHPGYGNGKIIKISDLTESHDFPVCVEFKSGEEYFTIDGREFELQDGRTLYHGNNLEIEVKEKLPVRTVERWVFLYKLRNNPIKASGAFDSFESCNIEADAYRKGKDYRILSLPIKVEIPE